MRRAVFLIALVCLLVPAGALASKSGGERVIRECGNSGEVKGKYTPSDYRYALKHIPSDLAEYTNCVDAIRTAQSGSAGHHGSSGGGGGGGGGFTGGGGVSSGAAHSAARPLSPADRAAIAGARRNGGRVAIGGGAPVTPGGPGIVASSVTHALPTPIIVLLILLGLGAAGGATVAVRTRVLSRRQA
jgi:hypothetical protein